MSRRYYDAIIIGSGQAGIPLAMALARNGWKTALIERDHLGGMCINSECTPLNALIASAHAAHMVRRADDFGIDCELAQIDFAAVIDRKNHVVARLRKDLQQQIEQAENLDLIKGNAYFCGERSIEIRLNECLVRQVEARLIFINTGTRPSIPLVAGIESVPLLDEADLMSLDTLPRHLIILGASATALEFAQVFARFGSRVSVLEMRDRILPVEDEDVANTLFEMLCNEDVDIRLRTRVRQVGRKGDGNIKLRIASDSDHVQAVTGSHMLVAGQRRPNTNHLNLEKAGIQTDAAGFIVTNENLQTNVPQIYALGDVRGGLAYQHVAYDDYRVLRTNLVDNGDATIENRLCPCVIFTDPELGRVGLTEHDARQRGYSLRVGKLQMNPVTRASEVGNMQGLMKVIIDATTNQILGCAVLGVHGGEILSVLQTAMIGHMPYTALHNRSFAHPTVTKLLDTLFGSLSD